MTVLDHVHTDDTTEEVDPAPDAQRSGRRRLVWAVAWVAVALVPFFVCAPWASDPETFGAVRASLDDRQKTVATMAASAAALSVALGLVPGDSTTPVAGELADLSSTFMLVIGAIFLQKILLAVSGKIAFAVVLPAACAAAVTYLATRILWWRQLAARLMMLAVFLVLAVPLSIWAGDTLDRAHAATVDDVAAVSVQDAPAEPDAPVEDVDDAPTGNLLDRAKDAVTGALDSARDAVVGAAESTADVADRAIATFNLLMERLALLVVTTCVIPVVTIVLLAWTIRSLFGLDLHVTQAGRVVRSATGSGVRAAHRGVRRRARR